MLLLLGRDLRVVLLFIVSDLLVAEELVILVVFVFRIVPRMAEGLSFRSFVTGRVSFLRR